jgi:hypothetical protein
MKPLEILIDFDGTVVAHDFPNIGKEIGAEFVLKSLTNLGHKLILFTIRSDSHKNLHTSYLIDAVKWFEEKDIPLYGIQKNPTQHLWTSSPKAYGQLMFDDIAIGTPLLLAPKISDRPFVWWHKICSLLYKRGVLDIHQSSLIQNEIKDFFKQSYNITEYNKYIYD